MTKNDKGKATNFEDRLILADYLLADEEVRPPGVRQLTVFSEGIRSLNIVGDEEAFFSRLSKNINRSIWGPKKGSKYNEGFLDLNIDLENNTFSCVYAKESALKFGEERDLRIVENRMKAIISSFKVKIEAAFADNKSLLTTFFGGEELFLAKARENFLKCVREALPGGFSQILGEFSPEDMRHILNEFGEDVEEIELSPGTSDKLKRFIKEHHELVYEAHARFFGYRIRMAPAVRQLLEDEEIRIREIKGYVTHNGIKVKATIIKNGRVHFYFPSSRFDDLSIYEAANELHKKLRLPTKTQIEQTMIDSFNPLVVNSQEVGHVN